MRSVASLALLLLSLSACARPNRDEVRSLERQRDALRAELARLTSRDPLLVTARRDPGNVAVVLRTSFVQALVRDAVARYLDRVRLDLAPDLRIEQRGKVKVPALFGRITAGSWRARIRLERVEALLAAGPPTLTTAKDNRLGMTVPLRISEARGTGSVRFAWDASGVAAAVCRDFRTSLRIQASVPPGEYPLLGSVRLGMEAGSLVAIPEAAHRNPGIRLPLDLSKASWARVRRVLEGQDKLLRCGIALDPDGVMEKLRALLARGIRLRLPASLFRALTLPGGVQESVQIESRSVELSVRPARLELGPQMVWYSAHVETRIGAPLPTEGWRKILGASPGWSGGTPPDP